MTKKLVIGTMLLAGVVFFSMGSVSASEEAKPWDSMSKFRGEESLSAQELEVPKEEFHLYRTESREEHRESRLEERNERLMASLERGCITEEEMASKMETRRGRFAK